jgi:GT2 family glycosyltransferase
MSIETNRKLAIIILFFNKLKQTTLCINSFLPSGENIYVLNNGSNKKEFQKLQDQFKSNCNVYFKDAGENLGPAGGRNLMIQNTTEPWLLFVDSDITVLQVEKWKFLLETFMTQNPESEIICPRIFNIHENTYMERLNLKIKGRKMILEKSTDSITNVFPEGGVVIHRNVFMKNGLYDEKMFAFEGFEFALRAIKSQFGELKVSLLSEVDLIHDHQYQINYRDKESVYERYNEDKIGRSFDHFLYKHKIEFEHEWHYWSKNQRDMMTTPYLLRQLRKILNRFLDKLA